MSYTKSYQSLEILNFTAANPSISSNIADVWVFTGGVDPVKQLAEPVANQLNVVWVKNNGSVSLTVDGDGFDIDGSPTLTLLVNEKAHLLWTGTEWLTI
jgi:hypothetical protein